MTINIPGTLLTSWKSTLVGIVSAVVGVIQASSYHGDWMAAIHDRNVQMAMLIAVLGFISKDFNVTGGNVGQPSTPAALKAANQAPNLENLPKG